jgi:hypothetical protein
MEQSIPPLPPKEQATQSPSTSAPPQAQASPADPAKIEYDRLIQYFDKLVKYSLLAITAILALAAGALWKSTEDLKSQAATSINATEASAKREISEIGKTASVTAVAEAQKAIDAAFEKQNVQRMIEGTTEKKVNAAVEAAVQKDLGARIDAFRVLIREIGEVSNHGAQLRLGFRSGLTSLLQERQNPDPTVRAYASSTLTLIATDYERSFMINPIIVQKSDFFFLPALSTPKQLMGIIRNQQDPVPYGMQQVTQAFLDMRKRVGWEVQVFDIPAAEKWCAEHKPKCDE